MEDKEYLRLAAEEAEFKRAKERLTLKHKNTSKWARRALKRGINVMDEGQQIPFDLSILQHMTVRMLCMGVTVGEFSSVHLWDFSTGLHLDLCVSSTGISPMLWGLLSHRETLDHRFLFL